MKRQVTTFKCPNCGHRFRGPNTGDDSAQETIQLPCPVCGTKSPKENPGIIESIKDIFG